MPPDIKTSGVIVVQRICVIGGGLAGGIVAAKLAEANHSVTLLERGSVPAPYDPDDEVWTDAKPKAAFTRGTGIGGTSNYWHGGLTILDRTDVEAADTRLGHPKIPVPYSELRHLYDQAVALMHGADGITLADIEKPQAKLDQEIPLNSNVFRLKRLLYPTAPFSSRGLIEQAKQHHGLEVVPGFEVKRIRFSNGARAVSVEGLEGGRGNLKTIHADTFVLCAGGLGSPKILLESAPESSQLQALPIGRFLIDHPTGFVFKAKLRRRMNLKPLFGQPGPGFRVQHGFVLQPDKLSASGYRNHILFLRPALSMKDPLTYDFLKRKLVAYRGRKLRLSEIAYLFQHTDLLFDAVNFKFGLIHSTKYVSGLVFAEQLPGEHGRVFHDQSHGSGIEWDISKSDSESLERFLNVFFESHSDFIEDARIFPDIRQRLDTSGHHSGTCRMASHAGDGVVDPNLRVFGIENLFVVDGSVLGFTGSANTGLTIAALALKCSQVICNG